MRNLKLSKAMKKKKLTLNDLTVTSFVTAINNETKGNLKGGVGTYGYSECNPCIPPSEACIHTLPLNQCIAVQSIPC